MASPHERRMNPNDMVFFPIQRESARIRPTLAKSAKKFPLHSPLPSRIHSTKRAHPSPQHSPHLVITAPHQSSNPRRRGGFVASQLRAGARGRARVRGGACACACVRFFELCFLNRESCFLNFEFSFPHHSDTEPHQGE